MFRKIFLVSIVAVLIGACSSSKTERITVASRQGNCVGVAPQKCLLIRPSNGASWVFWYEPIESFDYEPGYEYVLDVKKESIAEPAADQSAIKLVLVKIVSKDEKTSENLPEDIEIAPNIVNDTVSTNGVNDTVR